MHNVLEDLIVCLLFAAFGGHYDRCDGVHGMYGVGVWCSLCSDKSSLIVVTSSGVSVSCC